MASEDEIRTLKMICLSIFMFNQTSVCKTDCLVHYFIMSDNGYYPQIFLIF